MFYRNHEQARDATRPAARSAHPGHGLDRRHRRDRAAVHHREHDREGGGRAALHAARARRPQHLRPRGLLRLPQPDDPAVPRRGRALRPLQPRRREHVRPPVPVGLEAHRAGPRPRRRQVFQRLARRAPDRPALGGAGIDHAALSASWPSTTLDAADIADHLRANAHRRRALHRRDDRERRAPTCVAQADARRRPRRRCWRAIPRPRSATSTATRPGHRDGCAGRLPADARHAGRLHRPTSRRPRPAAEGGQSMDYDDLRASRRQLWAASG